MSELLEKRLRFTRHFAALIIFANKTGYQVAIGQDGQKHMTGSLHYIGLAKDLLLYQDGKYLTKTEDYKYLGQFWKLRDSDCRWGGDFSDGGHFSIAYQGKA